MASESYSGPVYYFDYHLKILEESYIQFFRERIRIEETYIDSLRRLHSKHRALDTYRDDHSDYGTSMRKAWREVEENAERETQTREAFLDSLKSEVLNPLVSLKETQERTRKRIKEDSKVSAETYAEYAETVLPRLKRSYLRKCQEAEHERKEYKSTSFEQNDPSSYHNRSASQSIGSPAPLRPLTRQISVHHPGNRARSPSSSTSLGDIAYQGKKQLSSMINFLNDGKTNSPEAAARNVRAKREADDAGELIQVRNIGSEKGSSGVEKEYRKAVHWLETLRIRRTKTLESGCNSIETLIKEVAGTLKNVLTCYMSGLLATSSTMSQLTAHLEPFVKEILPENDAFHIISPVRRKLSQDIPKPVLYHNYMVGPCNDLIFGVALVDYATTHGLPDGSVPKIIDLCINEIEERGLGSEGLYRISGRMTNVQELKAKIERDEKSFKFNPIIDDVACVASLLKLYLRELPEPVFKFPLAERIQHTQMREENIVRNFPLIRSKIRRLPPIHQATLRRLIQHLSKVASRSLQNKMDAKNLSIVFNGVVFGEEELPKLTDILSLQNIKDTVLEDLIVHAPLVFDELTPPSHEAPLPPAPPEEPKPKLDYGSVYTRTHTLPPSLSSAEAQDFAPTLPPRPGQSIHRRSHVQVQKKEVNRRSMIEDLSTISEHSSISSEGTTLEPASAGDVRDALTSTTEVGKDDGGLPIV